MVFWMSQKKQQSLQLYLVLHGCSYSYIVLKEEVDEELHVIKGQLTSGQSLGQEKEEMHQ